MMAAETAIADQYAAQMIQNPSRTYQNGNDVDPLNMTGPVMSGMNHSYRNVGGTHSVAIPGASNSTTNAKSGQATQGTIYEKLRNSYQSPSGMKYNQLNQ